MEASDARCTHLVVEDSVQELPSGLVEQTAFQAVKQEVNAVLRKLCAQLCWILLVFLGNQYNRFRMSNDSLRKRDVNRSKQAFPSKLLQISKGCCFV